MEIPAVEEFNRILMQESVSTGRFHALLGRLHDEKAPEILIEYMEALLHLPDLQKWNVIARKLMVLGRIATVLDIDAFHFLRAGENAEKVGWRTIAKRVVSARKAGTYTFALPGGRTIPDEWEVLIAFLAEAETPPR